MDDDFDPIAGLPSGSIAGYHFERSRTTATFIDRFDDLLIATIHDPRSIDMQAGWYRMRGVADDADRSGLTVLR